MSGGPSRPSRTFRDGTTFPALPVFTGLRRVHVLALPIAGSAGPRRRRAGGGTRNGSPSEAVAWAEQTVVTCERTNVVPPARDEWSSPDLPRAERVVTASSNPPDPATGASGRGRPAPYGTRQQERAKAVRQIVDGCVAERVGVFAERQAEAHLQRGSQFNRELSRRSRTSNQGQC